MRLIGGSVLLVLGVFCGCSSAISPGHSKLVHKPEVTTTHPYFAALFLGPEITAATASVQTPEGERSTVEMGDYLQSALRRAAGRVFDDVVVVAEPTMPTAELSTARVQDIWPTVAPSSPLPDLIVICRATYLKGHARTLPSCDDCEQSLTFRAEIAFQIQDMAGNVLGRGQVAGHGATGAPVSGTLPLTASFRGAMAEAVETLSSHLALALSATPIREPAPRYAARDRGMREM